MQPTKHERNFKAVDEANSEITKRQSEVERLSAELEKAIDLAKDADA